MRMGTTRAETLWPPPSDIQDGPSFRWPWAPNTDSDALLTLPIGHKTPQEGNPPGQSKNPPRARGRRA
eukprot:638258-Pyramimonas_sp.AAC.1